ncbi:uncharacterized [Tachysurus ichikawai]
MACSCKLEALSQYLRSSLRSRVVTERSIHTKKRECPLEKAFAVPLIATCQNALGWHQIIISWHAPHRRLVPISTNPPLFYALLRTHGTVVVVASGRSDSRQLRIVFASWDAWHCHFINYL